MLSNPAVKAEVERLEREEMPMLDVILKARNSNSKSKMTRRRAADSMNNTERRSRQSQS